MACSADVTKKKDDLCVLVWEVPQNNHYMTETEVHHPARKRGMRRFKFTPICIKKHSKDTEKRD